MTRKIDKIINETINNYLRRNILKEDFVGEYLEGLQNQQNGRNQQQQQQGQNQNNGYQQQNQQYQNNGYQQQGQNGDGGYQEQPFQTRRDANQQGYNNREGSTVVASNELARLRRNARQIANNASYMNQYAKELSKEAEDLGGGY